MVSLNSTLVRLTSLIQKWCVLNIVYLELTLTDTYPTLTPTNRTCHVDILCFKHTHLTVRCKNSGKVKVKSLLRQVVYQDRAYPLSTPL